MFKKGAIILGSKRSKKTARHPIVYWSDNDDGSFLGLVLTHSSTGKNIKMEKSHFGSDDEGLKFDQKRPTYVVPCLFMKPAEWGPYKQVAQVTILGLGFLEENIDFDEVVYWDDFIKTNC